MARRKWTQEKLEEACRLRYTGAKTTGELLPWHEVAKVCGIHPRYLRDLRKTPEWGEALRAIGDPVDQEALLSARWRLAELVHHKNPHVALNAARAILQIHLGYKLAVEHSGQVVQVAQYDLSGVDSDTLRRLASEVAQAERIGPGLAALPAPVVTDHEPGDLAYIEVEAEAVDA
jgi:hypothetical protein